MKRDEHKTQNGSDGQTTQETNSRNHNFTPQQLHGVLVDINCLIKLPS